MVNVVIVYFTPVTSQKVRKVVCDEPVTSQFDFVVKLKIVNIYKPKLWLILETFVKLLVLTHSHIILSQYPLKDMKRNNHYKLLLIVKKTDRKNYCTIQESKD